MLPGAIYLRDTKNEGNGPELPFTPEEWVSFVGRVRGGFLPL